MNHWMFTVTQKKSGIEVFTPNIILKQRLNDKFWGLGERTPNRRALKQGDRIVFYEGNPYMVFSATAMLASDSFTLSDDQKKNYDHGSPIYKADYGVLLENIELWDKAKPIKDIISNLIFIENKENWGSYFQGGVRQLTDDDFHAITEGRQYTLPRKPVDSVISESQFALESHLEEFIDKNWKHINFGVNLTRYESDEQSGRQFPAGPWSIDFLCVDKASGDFVVIELKRGKSSDSTIGQILRYIGWVDENLAKSGQQTRGIIIAQDVDDALRYAIRGLKNISILTYKIDFKLFPFQG